MLGISEWGKVVNPLGCSAGKLLGVPMSFQIFNTVGIVIGICDGFLLGFALGKKLRTKEVC